jgi:hypothetical protein
LGKLIKKPDRLPGIGVHQEVGKTIAYLSGQRNGARTYDRIPLLEHRGLCSVGETSYNLYLYWPGCCDGLGHDQVPKEAGHSRTVKLRKSRLQVCARRKSHRLKWAPIESQMNFTRKFPFVR